MWMSITCIGLRILNGFLRRKKPSNTSMTMGYLAILVTNQSGVARGYYPESDIRLVYDWMNEQLAAIGAHLDALYYCPHHPAGTVPEYTKVCTCRKPVRSSSMTPAPNIISISSNLTSSVTQIPT
jgi:hypothetical protein